MARALSIRTQTPWIRACNKKIVIVWNVCNLNNETGLVAYHELLKRESLGCGKEMALDHFYSSVSYLQPKLDRVNSLWSLEDVHLLIHGTTGQSVEYTTNIYEKTDISPFWEESETQKLRHKIDSAIVVVIDLEELKNNVTSKIEFNGVMFYKKNDKECLLPIEDVKFSSMETMGPEFDVISSDPIDTNIMLAILAATEKTDLVVRHIKKHNDPALSLDVFCKYLSMDKVPNCDNIAIHRKSSYHILNGVMLVLHSETTNENGALMISVYSRTPSQVLALIHHINDAVPLTLVITTPNVIITAKDDALSTYNEETMENTQLLYNYQNYATSILNRTELVLKYLDDSMVKMNESKSSVVQSKIGTEIDLFAGGELSFLEFKKIMREEAVMSVKTPNGKDGEPESEVMVID